ncbi:MAG: hypothetical protein LBS26_04885 [Campylobacteraceae bacterium]|nr:hypothetical protein [Campylobacteraceae bacterium]
MIRPKGFGKKYFTLSSIQAHSCTAKLHSKLVSVCLFFTKANKDKEPTSENDPPTESKNLLDYLNVYCIFSKQTQKIKSKKAFYRFYNCLHYDFCRSGIDPPKTFSFTHFFNAKFYIKG